MRLKHLTLQGYKSFATKTEFHFSEGITAIVGPNGSGKSNVADAVRWVLGEQRLRTLRGRSTADMIFSGGAVRARAGMAEVSLILDNADGGLPVAFTEVVITRRAYRSGENEHYLNGSRVRWRDLTDLLSESGLGQRHYVVVGQGLVDAALSLRAEERRSLFEEAAGISLYRTRRELTLQRLVETERNLERVSDIMSEIAPRVHRLETEARREQERQRVVAHLGRLRRTWYGYEWGRSQATLGPAKERASALAAEMASKQEQLSKVIADSTSSRSRHTELRATLRDWRRLYAGLREGGASLAREIAVAEERARSTDAQREELLAELERLSAQETEQSSTVARTAGDVVRLEQELENRRRNLRQVEGQWQGLRRQAADEGERYTAVEQDLTSHRARLSGLDGALQDSVAAAERAADEQAAIAERTQWLKAQREAAVAHIDRLGHQISLQTAKVAAARLRVTESEEAVQERRGLRATWERRLAVRLESAHQPPAELDELEQGLAQRRSMLAQTEEELAAAASEAARLTGEQEALGRVHLGPDAHRAGIAAIAQAGIDGVRGPISALFSVPSEWAQGIEAALGDDLRAVVVERASVTSEVGRAVDAAGGRVTLLPLDSLREPSPLPSGTVSGADVADCEALVRPAVQALLGTVALCGDASTARELIDAMPPGSRCTTPDGFVLRADGALSVGQIVVDGALSLEKAKGELGRRLAEATERREDIQQRRAGLAREIADLTTAARDGRKEVDLTREENERADREQLAQARSETAVTEQAHHDRREALDREMALADQYRLQLISLEKEAGEALAEATALDTRLADRQLEAARPSVFPPGIAEAVWADVAVPNTPADLARVTRALGDEREAEAKCVARIEQRRHEASVRATDAREAASAFEREQLSRARTQVAVVDETLRGSRSALDREQTLLERLRIRMTDRHTHADALKVERERLKPHIDTQRADASELDGKLLHLSQRIAPAEDEVTVLDGLLRELGEEERLAEARVRDAESRWQQAKLEVERTEDGLRLLAQRIEQDLGLVDFKLSDGVTAQTPLPLRPLVSDLPIVEELPIGLEDEIQRLRARERRYRGVNPNALAEYEEARERHRFLEDQSNDLVDAATQLRHAVAELDHLMEDAFRETFDAVAAEFSRVFPVLFGGGSAYLELTEPGDLLRTGVDVVARPPGKRGQRLAMLSGGERALTATALLFSLLAVSPTPFCVLDEVDATLDEANAGRFRVLLDDRAQRTQFIVITHNRVTVEAADTIYGVSMGRAGVSQVVSLKLDPDEPKVPA